MKVIVNDTTPLIVEDAEGNVLYEWNPPFKDKITYASKGKSVIDYISDSFVSGDTKK
ncbi:hypothetical protein P4597_27460 [Peribacillus simplex]|uniref:hypothetical protein n=1 Tax=Peribacillus simplex TaxID=1478 RepID=UPI002E1CD932|nr:hypothetical protein [Peribacillus simplex]